MVEATPPPQARQRPAAPRPTPSPRPNSAPTCSTHSNAKEVEDVSPGELTLQGTIGNGVSAEVFQGLYRGETVAIKVMKLARKFDVKEQIQFNREVAVLTNVDHPNLIKVFGVCLSQRPYQIVTELCLGGTVFDLLYNSKVELDWAQQVKMATDVAAAMTYLHNFVPRIVHRDLKSLNLLLADPVTKASDVPFTKVADFGLAKMREQVNTMTRSNTWGKMTNKIGTLLWMAPECYAGTAYDEKVDVYSYSMCLYEMICLKPPFMCEGHEDVGDLVTRGVRPTLDAVPHACPMAVKTLMMKCWAANPKMRPAFEQILMVMSAVPTTLGKIGARPPLVAPRDPSGFTSKALARGPLNSVSI